MVPWMPEVFSLTSGCRPLREKKTSGTQGTNMGTKVFVILAFPTPPPSQGKGPGNEVQLLRQFFWYYQR